MKKTQRIRRETDLTATNPANAVTSKESVSRRTYQPRTKPDSLPLDPRIPKFFRDLEAKQKPAPPEIVSLISRRPWDFV